MLTLTNRRSLTGPAYTTHNILYLLPHNYYYNYCSNNSVSPHYQHYQSRKTVIQSIDDWRPPSEHKSWCNILQTSPATTNSTLQWLQKNPQTDWLTTAISSNSSINVSTIMETTESLHQHRADQYNPLHPLSSWSRYQICDLFRVFYDNYCKKT